MTEAKALSLLHGDENAVSIQSSTSRVEQIEEELLRLGVRQVLGSELSSYLTRNDGTIAVPNVEKPADTNTVKWYVYNYTYNSYGSKRYDVQRLVAVGNNAGGTLVTGEDNYKFYSGKTLMANLVDNALSIIVQKAIGQVKFLQWTPYELLFSTSTSNAFNSSYVTYRCVSSIAFSYVKESSQSDDYYELSYCSNKFSIAATAHGAAVVDSVPKTYSVDKTATVSADNYSAIIPAIESYLNIGEENNYIYYFDLQSYDGAYTKRAYVPTPLAGPGQVW